MFRLAVFTDEISQDFERALKVAKEFHLQGVEIRSAWDTQPQDFSQQQIAEMKRLLAAYQMPVCIISSPFLKCKIWDEAAYQTHFDILRRCIVLGKTLGTDLIRGFTFWKTEDTPEVWNEVERIYRQAIPLLEAAEVMIGIENEGATSASTCAQTAAFLARLNHPRVRGVFDPANERYEEKGIRPFPEAFRQMQPYLIHVHLKDVRRDAAGKAHVTLLGEGDIDFRGLFRELADSNYPGWASLETHWHMIDLPQPKTPAEAALEPAERASRLSLVNLMDMLP